MTRLRAWADTHRRQATIAILGGLTVLLLVVAAVIVTLIRADDGVAQASPTATPFPSSTVRGSPSVSLGPSPSPSSSPPPLADAGPFGAIVLADALRVRDSAGTGQVVGTLSAGEFVHIGDGPITIDGQDWYSEYRYGVQGWVSSGPADAPYLDLRFMLARHVPARILGVASGPDGHFSWGVADHASFAQPTGLAAVSRDGTTWTAGSVPDAAIGAAEVVVADGPAGWLMFASDPTGTALAGEWRSQDGVTWEDVTVSLDSAFAPLRLVASDAGYALIVMDRHTEPPGGSALFVSPDGRTWTEAQLHGSDPLAAAQSAEIVGAGAGFLAWWQEAGSTFIVYSADGMTWADPTDPASLSLGGHSPMIASGGSTFVAITYAETDGRLLVWTAALADSILTWARQPGAEATLAGMNVERVVSTGDAVFAIGRGLDDGHVRVWQTRDGSAWTEVDGTPFEATSDVAVVAAGSVGLVAVGGVDTAAGTNPRLWTSAAGSGWTSDGGARFGTVDSALMGACPSAPADYLEVLALPGAVAAECFGDSAVSFRAWLTAGEGCGEYPASGSSDPPWLATPFSTSRIVLSPAPTEADGCGSAAQHPTLAQLPDLQQWVTIAGHWADAASPTCRWLPDRGSSGSSGFIGMDSLAFRCRTTLVATSVTPEG